MNTFAVFAALSVLLLLVLAANVSRIRIQEQIGNGDGGNRRLQKAIRAHANALEHLLPYALLLLAAQQLGVDAGLFAGLAYGYWLVRVLHGVGMLGSIFRLRQVTAGLTYLMQLVLCLLVLHRAVIG